MKQTAVEFLQEALSIHLTFEQQMKFEGLFQQAKEMEKEQIEKAVIFGNRQDFYDGTEEIGNNYYNKTYTQSSE